MASVKLADTHIRLAHGNGGRLMRELIEHVFARHLGSSTEDISADARPFELSGGVPLATTDGFTVQPLEYPGGDIGSLAVNGTVNDLAVSGARPLHLTLSAIIEEGLEVARLERIVRSLSAAAAAAGVRVIAGDTKVVPHGHGGGLYLVTAGIGVRPVDRVLGFSIIREGDAVLTSGPLGDHGAAVMLARGEFEMTGRVRSDCANVVAFTETACAHGVRFMRDPTRGGVASVANEIAAATGLGVRLNEDSLPVRDAVRSVCEMLGYDPLYLASEGRVIAVAPLATADRLLDAWRELPDGGQASIIGRIAMPPARVVLETAAGGERIIHELEDDPLPRIC